jgi:NADP-dependent 3-hydroxy acid dehydrogenase YdfG
LDALKQELGAKYPSINILTHVLDVRVKANVNAAIDFFGDIDVLVNNAGKPSRETERNAQCYQNKKGEEE